MKLTIIPIDSTVYVDGVSYNELDLSNVPAGVHALQFNDATNKGWVEFADNDDGTKPQNQIITELPSWATSAKAKWDEAKQAQAAAILAQQQAAAILAQQQAAAILAKQPAAANQPQTQGTQPA